MGVYCEAWQSVHRIGCRASLALKGRGYTLQRPGHTCDKIRFRS